MTKTLVRTISLVVTAILLLLWFLGGRTCVDVAEVTIAASPERVFTYLTEPEKVKQWMAGVVEITPRGETPPNEAGHRVGAKAQIVVDEHGTRFEMEDEVLRSEPNRLLEVRITSSMFNLTNLYELTDNAGQTHIKQTLRADYQGFVRFFVPFMAGEVQRKLAADFQRLKSLLETP